MEKLNRTWLDQVARFIEEYTRLNPGYSSLELRRDLTINFSLNAEDAGKLVKLVEQKYDFLRPGLGAIELNLTFNCNLACAYCFVHRKSSRERMSFATAKKAIDLLITRAAFPTVIITLFGGEPLLEFPLIKQVVPYALAAAQERGLNVNWAVTTNGTLVNEEILQFFARHQISMLLSIDGGAATHDRYRRTKSGQGTWHRLAGLIPLIKQYQPWLGARMTVSTEAVHDMAGDFKQLVDLGINQLIIAPAQGSNCWANQQIEQYGLNLVKIAQSYQALKLQGVPIYIEELENNEEIPRWGCRAGSTSLAIAPNGDISPCSKLLGLTDEAGRCIVGNVHTGIDEKLLEPFLFPLGQQSDNCRRCSRPCSGGCYAVNFEQTGNHFLPSEESCLFHVVCQESARIYRLMAGGADGRP